MTTVTLDFETRSELNVKDVGAYVYATHPSTDVLCLCWMVDDGPTVRIWHPGHEDNTRISPRSKSKWKRIQRPIPRPPDPDDLFALVGDAELGDALFEAHNAMFERLIWRHVLVARYGFPDVPEDAWRCSAAKSAAFSLPRALDKAVKALGLPLKDSEGHRVMLKLTKPRKPTKTDPDSKWHSNRKDLLRVFRYCVQDVRAERALSRELRPLPPDELAVWQLDQRINQRGVWCDRDLAERAMSLIAEASKRANHEIAEITGGRVTGTTKREELLAWMQQVGHDEFVNTQAGTIDQMLEGDDLAESVRRVLTLWRSLNRTSTKKFKAMVDRMAADQRLRDLLAYYGADTGRWAGRGVQPQNFPRNSPDDMEEACRDILAFGYDDLELLYGDVMELLSGVLRGALAAAPGHHLVVADYSAIEARGTFWISNHHKGIQRFRDIDAGKLPGQDIYTLQASDILERKVTKADKDDRQVWGKVPVLGCGYQMGPPKLVSYAASMGTVITEEQAERIVAGYRESNAPVRWFWPRIEETAIEAVRRGPGAEPVKCGRLLWGVRGKFLHCRLPSGRLLAYYAPRLVPKRTPWGKIVPGLEYSGVNSFTRQWERIGTYGGKLTENVVQALCRDLMADAMLRADRAGYTVILTVHDEIVTEVPASSPPDTLANLEELMSAAPDWADGFPIAAEGWRGKRYRK